MPAQSFSFTSVLRVFKQFIHSLDLSSQTVHQATEGLAQIYAQNSDVNKWQKSDIDLLRLGSEPKQLLHSFVSELSSFQADLLLSQFVLALKDTNCSASTVKNYRSDIKQFLTFSQSSSPIEFLTKPKFQEFIGYERQKGLKDSSITRKLKSLSQFGQWIEEQENGLNSSLRRTWLKDISIESILEEAPIATTLASQEEQLTSAKPAQKTWQQKIRQSISNRTQNHLLPYLNLALLVLFFIGAAFLGFQQLRSKAVPSLAFPSDVVRPNRVLSFQGRLTDTAQNPITSATNMEFRLYDALTSGTLLWDSGTCSIDPDQDGIFSTGLGSDCGAEIDLEVFSENANVWLEVQVVAETLTPRQPIQTVAYAINSETVQGFPISASESATINTILVMNEWGEVVLGETSPILKSVSGTFSLEGEALTLQTVLGSNGDITLSPDGTGGVVITSPTTLEGATMTGYLSAPGATLSATYAGGTPLVVRGGPSGTANITEWQDSAGTALSVIDEAGFLGIGINNPTQALDVRGNVFVRPGSNSSDTFTVTNSSGSNYLQVSTSGGFVSLLNSIYAAAGGLFSSGNDQSLTFAGGGSLANGANIILNGSTHGTNPSVTQFRVGSTEVARFDGSGNLTLNTQNDLRLADADSTNYVGLQAPAVVGSDITYTLPGTATNGYVLQTDGSGVMTWADPTTLAGAATYWNQADGALFAKNSTVDLLIGGQSTASAKFAFINNNSGTPTATIAGNLSLQVPTGSAPSTNLNVLNGGTLNIRTATTGQGDAGLGTIATFGNRNVTLYGNRTGANGLARALITSTGTGANNFVHINPDNIGAADTFTILQVDGGGVEALFNVYGNGRDKVVIGGADSTASIRTHILTASNSYVGLAIEANSGQTAALQEWQNSSGVAQSWIDESGNLRIGSAAPDTGKLNVTGAFTGKALAILNETGDQDIFTASASGTTRFVIQNDGDVGIGTATPYAPLTITPSSATDKIVLFDTGSDGVSANDYKIGIASGVFYLNSGGGFQHRLNGTSRLTMDGSGNVNVGTDSTPDSLFSVGSQSQFQVNTSGNIARIGDAAHTIADSSGDLQLTSASTTISLNDNVTFAGTTTLNGVAYTWPGADAAGSGYALTSDGAGTLSWSSVATDSNIHWSLANGSIFAKNSTVDFLVGGQSTASAKFAVLNVNTGTPVASISANSGNIATYLTGDGSLATTNRNNLTIGNSSTYDTTGNVLINPNGTGRVGIGTTTPLTNFQVDGKSFFNQTVNIDYGHDLLGSNADGGLVFRNSSGFAGSANAWMGTYFNSDGVKLAVSSNADRAFIITDYANSGIQHDVTLQTNPTLYLFSATSPDTNNTQWLSLTHDQTNGVITSGTGNIILSPASNVGIGTTAPGAKLDVAGSASLSGTLAFRGTTDPKIDILNGENFGIRTSPGGDAGLAEKLTVLGSGRVGIGQTTPITKLHVTANVGSDFNQASGAAILSGLDYTVGGVAGHRGIFPLDTGFRAGIVGLGDQTNTIDILPISSYGSVGVVGSSGISSGGRTNIGVFGQAYFNQTFGGNSGNSGRAGQFLARLTNVVTDFNGTLYGTYNVGDSRGGTSTGGSVFGSYNEGFGETNNTVYGGYFTASGGTTNYALYTNQGENSFGNNLTLRAQSDLRLADSDSSNYIALQSPAVVSSDITYTLPGTVSNGYVLQTDGSGVMTWADPTTLAGAATYWNQANGALFAKNSTVDFLVGGQSTASAKFAVLNVNTGTPVASISANSGNIATYLTGDGSLATTNRNNLTIGNSSTYDTTGNVLINPNGTGRVGIGTTAPTQLVDVVGGFVQSRVTGNTATGFLIDNSTSPVWGLQAAVGGRFELYDYGVGTSRLAVSTTGNVGIGTTTPAAKLDINGDLFAPTATFSANYAAGVPLTVKGGPSGTANIFRAESNNGSRFVSIDSTGALDVNTVSPETTARISSTTSNATTTLGGSNGQFTLALRNRDTTTNNRTDIGFMGSGGGSLAALIGVTNIDTTNSYGVLNFATRGAGGFGERMRIDSTGNVGIGDTSPDAKLNILATTEQLRLDYDDSNYASFFTQSDGELQLTTTGTDPDITLNPGTGGSLIFADLDCSGNTNGGVLTADASGVVSCGDDDVGTGGTSYWRQANGAISPTNDTNDVLIGSAATTSAKFGFLNVNSGTPVASISANSGDIATYITGDGTLATTNRNNLTIGNSSTYNTTGNVLINPNGTGRVGIGTTTPSYNLHLAGGTDTQLGIVGGDYARTVYRSSNASSDSEIWHTYSNQNGDFYISALDDSESIEAVAMIFDRNGTSITDVSIPEGNFGVGTSAPSDKLEVLSTSDAQLRLAYDTSNYQAFQVAADGGLTWSALGTDADLNINFSGATDGDFSINTDDLFVDTSTGRVGINNTTPGARLDINGDLFAPTATFSANYAGGIALTAKGGPSGTANIFNVQDSSSNTLAFVDSAGNFTLNAQNDLRLGDSDSSNYIALQSPAVVGSNITYTLPGSITNGYIMQTDGSGNLSWVSPESATGYWRLASGALSPTNDTTDLLIGSNATASAKFGFLNVNSGTPVASISANSGNIATYITGDGSLSTTNRNNLTIGNSSTYNTTGNVLINPNGTGRVGIGTTSPVSPLTVKGTNGSSTISFLNTANAIAGYFHPNGNGAGNLALNSAAGSQTISITGDSSGGVHSYFNAGNVGIGTTGPDRKLDVLDASNPQLRLTQADGTVYADFQVDSNGDLIVGVDGTTNQLVLDNGGNVGIGTAAPAAKLHVAQVADTSSSGINIYNTATTRLLALWADSVNNARIDSGSGGNSTLALNGVGTGFVGIGTITPGARLDVFGDLFAPTATFSANYAGGIALTAKGGPSGTANIFNIQDSSSNTLAFVDSAGNFTLNAQNDLRLADSDSSNYIALQAPGTVGSNITYTLPGTVTDGYYLQTDGSGTLSWAAVSGSNYWQLNNGTLSPFSLTADINLGATASSSAKISLAGSLTRGKAVAIFNQTEDQDILAASASGTTRFRIDQNGYVYGQRFVDIANSSYFLDPAATDTSLTVVGKTGLGVSTPVHQLQVTSTNVGKALVALNETGTNDIFTASASGTTKMTLDNNGNLGLGNIDPVGRVDVALNFTYEQALTVTNGGSALFNSDVLIEIDTSSLISGSKMNNDCSDIRFTTSDKQTQLTHWVESGCNTTTTQIWVRVPTIANGSNTLYLFYGNANATTKQVAWESSTTNAIFPFEASCPAGWTAVSALNSTNSFPRGNTSSGATGGSTTHDHTYTIVTNTSGSSANRDTSANDNSASRTTHTHTITGTSTTASNLPPYKDVIYCSYDSTGIPNTVTTDVLGFFEATPSAWTIDNSYNDFYLRGNATAGGSGGFTTHTHDISGTTNTPSINFNIANGADTRASNTHTHTYNITSDSSSTLSPYYDLIIAQPGATATLPEGSIVMFDAASVPPIGWSRFSGLDNRFVRGAPTSGGTGGSDSHANTVSSSVDSHSGNVTSGGGAGGGATVMKSHAHGVSGALDSSSNLPPYLDVVFYKKNIDNVSVSNGSEVASNHGLIESTVSQTGKLGIGTNTASWKLTVEDVSATASAMIANRNNLASSNAIGLQILLGLDSSTNPDTEDRFINFMKGNGTIIGKIQGNGSGGVTYATNGVDFAEYFKKSNPDEPMVPGDVICHGDGGVTKCSTNYTELLGIISDQAGFVGGSSREGDPNYALVGLVGQLRATVSSESGYIAHGAPLTRGGQVGTVSENVLSGQIIGHAISAYDPNNPGDGKVLVSIHVSYATAKGLLQLGKEKLSDVTSGITTTTYSLLSDVGVVIESVANYSSAVIANLTAGRITTSELIADQTTSNSLSTDLISPLASGSGDLVIDLRRPTSNSNASGANNDTNSDSTSPLGKLLLQGNLDVTGDATIAGSLTTTTLDTQSLTAQTAYFDQVITASLSAGTITGLDNAIEQQLATRSSRLSLLEKRLAQYESTKTQTEAIVAATTSAEVESAVLAAESNSTTTATSATTSTATSSASTSIASAIETITAAGYTTTATSTGYLVNNAFNSAADLNLELSDLNQTAADVTLQASTIFINDYIKVNGSGYVANSLGIGNTLLVQNQVTIGSADATISFTNSNLSFTNSTNTFAIQPSGQGTLNLMAGLLSLNQDGQAIITGDLTVTGNLAVKQTLLTNLVAPTDFTNPLQVQLASKSGLVAGATTDSPAIESRFEIINELGTPVATISAQGKASFEGGIGIGSTTDQPAENETAFTTNKTAGASVIKAGLNQVTIKSTAIGQGTLLYVTPVGSTNNQVLFVKSKTLDNPETPDNEAAFTIGFEQATTANVEFNWWMVN